jgi:hypothetical protein
MQKYIYSLDNSRKVRDFIKKFLNELQFYRKMQQFL